MTDQSRIFLAHVKQDSNGQWQPHLLEDHLRAVGELAESFAASFGSGDWGKLAGLWHDLGKYRAAFQGYIRTASGYEAHLETNLKNKVDHSTAGALHAVKYAEEKGQKFRVMHCHSTGAGLVSRFRLFFERIGWRAGNHGRCCCGQALISGCGLHSHFGITPKLLGQRRNT